MRCGAAVRIALHFALTLGDLSPQMGTTEDLKFYQMHVDQNKHILISDVVFALLTYKTVFDLEFKFKRFS